MPVRKKSNPERTCVGCRRTRPAADLIRCGQGPDNAVVVGRHLPGRGAWLCPTEPCVARAVSSGGFSRAFRARAVVEDPERLTRDVVAAATKIGGKTAEEMK